MTARGNEDELIRQLAKASYRCDERGRLASVNQWDGGVPPRFHLWRSAGGVVCLLRADVPDDLADRLEALASRRERGPHGRWAAENGEYLRLLSAHAPVKSFDAGLIYGFAQDVAPSVAPVALDESNAHLLQGGLEEWLPDVPHRRPFMAALVGGQAVAVCASVRISETVHVAGVETHPAHRRRGHAANAVVGWARAVRELGAEPIYSTSWENVASQGVARRLGLSLIGSELTIE